MLSSSQRCARPAPCPAQKPYTPASSRNASVQALLLVLCLLWTCHAHGQQTLPTSSEPLAVTKIDPPNWYSGLPPALLLVHGTGLHGAAFRLSDTHLQVTSQQISGNGHWAQLLLSASPKVAESVKLNVSRGNQHAAISYRFDAPRAADTGMAGVTARDVMYLIMTDRFADGDRNNDGPTATSAAESTEASAERAKARGWHGGDLQGVLQHLDYLESLGVTTVWLTPVYENKGTMSYHGYGATDYYAVDPHFGTLADLRELASALHAHHMKFVLDTVPNHVGASHPWVTDEPAPDWFHGTAADHIKADPDLTALLSPHAAERDRLPILHGWFANVLPDMNTDSPAVAQYLRQNVVWWIEQTGADGLRIDTFPYVNREFWHEFNGELRDLFPHLTEVGEIFDSHPTSTSAFAGDNTRNGVDTRLYTPFDFPTYFALRDVFGKGKPMTELTDVLAADSLYPHPERLVPFAGNHDVARLANAVPDGALRDLVFAYLLTMRGTPQLYSGDELAMPGKDDPDNRRDFPGGFPGQSEDAFHADHRTAAQAASFAWVQNLLQLRRNHPVLACGRQQVLMAEPDTLVTLREGSDLCPALSADLGNTAHRLLIVLQRGSASPLHIDLHHTAAEGCDPGQALLGGGRFATQNGILSGTTQDHVVILPCKN